MEIKRTLVIGASTNPERFSYKAIKLLRKHGHPVEAIGAREDKLDDVVISKTKIEHADIHTVTLYLSPKNQVEFYDYIMALKPKRIIFNPGTENADLQAKAKDAGIEVVEDCTLVMLNTGIF